MAALMGKLEAEVDYKSSADKFYNIIGSQSYHIANASGTVHEAESHFHGATLTLWHNLKVSLIAFVKIQAMFFQGRELPSCFRHLFLPYP
ncbi:hypothetical protein CFP56_036022 [Quercus suber]|uniref:Bet v I/Major latex protein domain-containing protein n=1 Tax=Quercus suber TaxID=58331 RepID=A0AAW0J7W3_QUESU